LWIVPAKVAGTWQSQLQVRSKPVPYEITLQQEFQMVSGQARVGGRTAKIENVKLRGDQLTFEFTAELDGMPVKHQLSGKVDGGKLEGTADLSGSRLQARMDWSATRAARSAAVSASHTPTRGAIQIH
ncbi:MAG TPA: hypothetical protein VGC70_01780, partial [Burkholderiales bacterium]